MEIAEAIKKAKRDMINEMGIDSFKNKLLNYPEQIRDQEKTITSLSQELKAAKGNLLAAEGLIMAEIVDETNLVTGKPKYSNKEAREAELAQRKQNDMEYVAALEHFNKAEEVYSSAQFDLKQLEDEFAAHKTAGQILAAKISLLA